MRECRESGLMLRPKGFGIATEGVSDQGKDALVLPMAKKEWQR